MEIGRHCNITGKTEYMEIYGITQEDVDMWVGICDKSRPEVSQQFRNVSADGLEFIKTGITPDIWDDLGMYSPY